LQMAQAQLRTFQCPSDNAIAQDPVGTGNAPNGMAISMWGGAAGSDAPGASIVVWYFPGPAQDPTASGYFPKGHTNYTGVAGALASAPWVTAADTATCPSDFPSTGGVNLKQYEGLFT